MEVPHPRLQERGFVLVPLAEVAPAWRHPRLGARRCGLARGPAAQEPASIAVWAGASAPGNPPAALSGPSWRHRDDAVEAEVPRVRDVLQARKGGLVVVEGTRWRGRRAAPNLVHPVCGRGAEEGRWAVARSRHRRPPGGVPQPGRVGPHDAGPRRGVGVQPGPRYAVGRVVGLPAPAQVGREGDAPPGRGGSPGPRRGWGGPGLRATPGGLRPRRRPAAGPRPSRGPARAPAPPGRGRGPPARPGRGRVGSAPRTGPAAGPAG